MIKIILSNNTQVEFDSPKEASQFMHSLYWREFAGQKTATPPPIQERKGSKLCVVCKKPRPAFQKKLCGDPNCTKELGRRWARKYYQRNKESIRARKREAYKKEPIRVPINEPTLTS